MTENKKNVQKRPGGAGVDAFLRKVASAPATTRPGERGRLIFALDATMSREPTWDRACHIQAEMFQEAASIGGLEIKVAYFRGFNEFRASKWHADSKALLAEMTKVHCMGGHTQIRKVLDLALEETRAKKVNALVFVGDCMEESADDLCAKAGELGLLGMPAFMFHEGGEPVARRTFEQIAKLTGGAYCAFDAGSARQLRELLRAVAIYAAGGRKALADYGRKMGGSVLQIAHQVK